MRWSPTGLLIDCDLPGHPGSHASTPAALAQPDGTISLLVSVRDDTGRSHVHELRADLGAGTVGGSLTPVLRPGVEGTFDDRGCSVGCLMAVGDEEWLYYTGWNTGGSVPFRNAIGLAIRRPGEVRFTRISDGPVLDRSIHDPYSVSYPFVERDGPSWRMWYGTHLRPVADLSQMRHGITVATSNNGVDWTPTGQVVVGPAADEVATVRPWIFSDGDRRMMLFAARDQRYRLHAAVEETDGSFSRLPVTEAGLPVPGHAPFALDEVTYPSVVDTGKGRYLLYNGDGYGRTGVGVARWAP